MALKGLENINEGVRSAILISVAVSYFAWDLGFELGAYGIIFFDKVFVIWSVTLALLLIFIIIPKRILPVPPALWVATAVPTLWVLVALANRAAPDERYVRFALTILGFVAVLFCLPYVAYMIASVLYPDFARMKHAAPKVGISIVIGTMILIGYLVGSNHERFLTCEDFNVAGENVPQDCASDPAGT